jgi:hypothetical protein
VLASATSMPKAAWRLLRFFLAVGMLSLVISVLIPKLKPAIT